jgi:hypothetical protein
VADVDESGREEGGITGGGGGATTMRAAVLCRQAELFDIPQNT